MPPPADPLEPPALVAAINGMERAQVKPAIATANVSFLFMLKASSLLFTRGVERWWLCQRLFTCDSWAR